MSTYYKLLFLMIYNPLLSFKGLSSIQWWKQMCPERVHGSCRYCSGWKSLVPFACSNSSL